MMNLNTTYDTSCTYASQGFNLWMARRKFQKTSIEVAEAIGIDIQEYRSLECGKTKLNDDLKSKLKTYYRNLKMSHSHHGEING